MNHEDTKVTKTHEEELAAEYKEFFVPFVPSWRRTYQPTFIIRNNFSKLPFARSRSKLEVRRDSPMM